MRYLDLTLPDLAANLALDEALLLEAESGEGGEGLRFWQWRSPAVVLGSGGRLTEEAIETACQADGVPILRRSSGGGTVLIGPGCLLYTLILGFDRHPALSEIRPSYGYILDRIGKALTGLLPGIARQGISDLAAGDRKFSGSAQQRKRHFLLHHGTLLYGFDLNLVAQYLHSPPRQPEYRAGREHGDFLCNLPTSAEDLKRRLMKVWDVSETSIDWPEAAVANLATGKYATDEWNRRR